MRNIEKAVQNVVDKSKEIDYDPAKDKNWCHLPMEMRMKCIRNMNFTTRTRLSVTSTIEKSLVESEKFHFDTISLMEVSGRLNVIAHDFVDLENFHVLFDDVNLYEQEWPTKMQFLRYVLKMCKVDELSSESFLDEGAERERIDPEIDLADFVPFGFKKLHIGFKCCGNVEILLDNCPNLEVVFLENCRQISQLLGLPAIINVKELRVANCVDWTALFGLVQKWIETDAQVGKSVQFSAFFPVARVPPDVRFVGRFIERTDGYIRIRMDDPTKQILMRHIGRDPSNKEYFSFKVILTDLPESEYGKGGEWITQLFETAVDDQDDIGDE